MSFPSIHLPFEQLPSLPAAIIPKVDLHIQKTDISALLQIKPSIDGHRRAGFFISDSATQTEETEVIDLKHAIKTLETLTQDAGGLRKDLSFAQHVLRANYERQLLERAMELYCRINRRLDQLERQQKAQMDIVRKSYQVQLDDAIHKIAGEYKAYYDDLLQGKTGTHDLRMRELEEELSEKEMLVGEQQAKINQLQARVSKLQDESNKEPSLSPIPTAISLEEANDLKSQIVKLEREAYELQGIIADHEDTKDELNKRINVLTHQLENEKKESLQLKKDFEDFRRNALLQSERAEKLAESQLASLEKQMKEKLASSQREAARRAQEEAELRRMKERALFEQEMEKQRNLEVELRARANRTQTQVVGDVELLATINKLEKMEQHHRQEINRLERELERTNKAWELKMTVMRKNFHALKDEFFVRHSLQRRASALHHATVGYAVNVTLPDSSPQGKLTKTLKPSVKLVSKRNVSSERPSRAQTRADTEENADSVLVIPPPSPTTVLQQQRSVHFDSKTDIPVCVPEENCF